MKTTLIAFTALAALPTALPAQTVRSDCYTHRNHVSCTTTIVPSLGDALGALIEARQEEEYRRRTAIQVAAYNRKLAEEKAAQEERERPAKTLDFQLWQVGLLVGNQDCPGARRYAAGTGNAEVVAHVAELCGK